MKITYGYVSNSSSASRLIYGNEIEYEDAIKFLKDTEKQILCVVEGAGSSGSCGDFVFRMTSKRKKLFDKYEVALDGERVRYFDVKKIYGSDIINVKEPLTGGSLYDIDWDDSSPCTDNADDKKFMKWLMRMA